MNDASKKRAKLFSFQYLFYDFVKITAALPGLIAFRPKLLYENDRAKKKIRGGALVIANHVGFADPVYLMLAVWYRRHRFICTADFFRSRARWLFRHFLCIPIERENFSMDSFREITSHLKDGDIVSMFPEGHVNEDTSGAVASFKSGMVLMAMRSGAPIVPIYIRKPAHRYNRVVMVIGEPVDITERYGLRPSFAQVEELADLLHDKETELKNLCT